MFGRQLAAAVRHPYRDIVKPGVRFVQATVTSIDPVLRRVVTAAGTFDADVLVVALGADYDVAATPGLAEGGHEFYIVAGALALRDVLPHFEQGPAIVGVCGRPFKCPPAPSEMALMLHDYLVTRGRRAAVDISLVMPFGTPVPPSPDTSKALLAAFEERGIRFVKDTLVKSLDPARKVAVLSDGSEMPYALFLGIPVHRVPQVVVESGLAAHAQDWVPVDNYTLATKIPGRLRRRRRQRRRHAEGGRLRRGRRARRRGGDRRARFAAARRPSRTRGKARATSSSEMTRSGVSTWTS